MSELDPRRLLAAFEELTSELWHYIDQHHDCVRTREECQRHFSEHARRVTEHTRMAQELTSDVHAQALMVHNEAQRCCARSRDVNQDVRSADADAGAACQKARQKVGYWTSQLRAAEADHGRAQCRLQTARANLEQAIREHSAAQAALSQAKSALSHCQNSVNRDNRSYRNCTSEQNALAQASRNVSAAESRCAEARSEENAAIADVKQAEEWIRRAGIALSTAQQALGFAERAISEAESARGFADRAEEMISAIDHDLAQVDGLLAEGRQTMQTLNDSAQRVDNEVREGDVFMQRIMLMEDELRHSALTTQLEVDKSSDWLYAFDHPEDELH